MSGMSKMDMLDQWLKDLIFPGNVNDFVHQIRDYKSDDQYLKEMCIYTNQFKYRIIACERPEDEGYLGCQVSARKMRAGEDWIRGNDLPDGDFNEDTWKKILYSIINYELEILSDHTKPADIPEDLYT